MDKIIQIEQCKSQPERLQLLNKLAIRQLEAIREINTDTIKKLEGKKALDKRDDGYHIN